MATPSRSRAQARGWRTACAAAALALAGAPALAQETFKLGIVSFLSGQAAESFGVPAVNGAKVLVDAFNKGGAPAPYNKVGFGGVKIEPVYVDENGGASGWLARHRSSMICFGRKRLMTGTNQPHTTHLGAKRRSPTARAGRFA